MSLINGLITNIKNKNLKILDRKIKKITSNQTHNQNQSTKHNQKQLSKTIKTQSKTINNHN